MTDLAHESSAETAPREPAWTPIAEARSIRPERGVAAIVDGTAVAVFRLPSETGDLWCCVDHTDPVTGVAVMARGLVGSTGPDQRPTIASPLYKERYDLETGVGVDDPSRSLTVHECRVVDGVVEVRIVGPETVTLR